MQWEEFTRRVQHLDHEIPAIMKRIVERLGEELLNAVIDEINRQDLIDTGTLINSFSRGDGENVWEFDEGRNAITLEVGSNLTYAEYLNDGYTIGKAHFVPGYFNGAGSFVYDRSAKTGFIARPRSFIGRKYFDIALKNFEGGMRGFIEKQLEKEIQRIMG
ncbi:HK97 gp10 family phage protein [Aneurinibacillus thermoaerophilus]|uniref:HK97 gp10 family phage protein n=1 Tax=Aneurinibacillus thermoaerophilus TaxID=143495 RepID=UPI002E20C037|nr:HK97 gp10 family phage protein [Aneurinibacillus thermoaerophilus]